MGFMNKLKNIFFEEEEEENEAVVDTTPPKIEKEEKEVIARKVELPKRKVEVVESKEIEEEVKPSYVDISVEKPNENELTKKNNDLIFDDVDFNLNVEKKSIKKEESKKTSEVKLYNSKETYRKETPKYDYDYSYKEKEKTTKTFTPSPIISPIYGILDKNYKKEEVKERKEIKISSRPVKMDFDSVRNKAFGELENDLFGPETDLVEEDKKEVKEERKERRKIYDMTSKEKPSIDKVTLGEADEYFNDLGLAYNTDYKDISKEINDGKVIEGENKKGDKLEDNLFDLIESMYDKED